MNTVKVRKTAPKKSVPITPFLEVTPSPKKSPYHSPQKIGLGDANIILIYLAFCAPPVKIEAETRPTGAKPRRRTLRNLNFGAFCAHPCRSQHLGVLGAAGTNTTHFYFSFSFDNLLFLSFVSPPRVVQPFIRFFFLSYCVIYTFICSLRLSLLLLFGTTRARISPPFHWSPSTVLPTPFHRQSTVPVQSNDEPSNLPPPSQTKQKLWNKYRNWP